MEDERDFISATQKSEPQPRRELGGSKCREILGQISIHVRGKPRAMQSMTAGKSLRTPGAQRTLIGRPKIFAGKKSNGDG